MDKTQSEVTDKIRSSIKEKLIEINVFVDDELPDYIMILIANKRSKHHMEKDLSLFLGNKTAEFTNWLWDLINVFKVGTKSKTTEASVMESKQSSTESKENRSDEDDVLNYDPAEEGETLYVEEMNQHFMSQNKVSEAVKSNIESKPKMGVDYEVSSDYAVGKNCDISKDLQLSIDSSKTLSIEASKKSDAVNKVGLENAMKTQLLSRSQKSAKVYPIQRTKQDSSSTIPVKKVEHLNSAIKPDYVAGVSSVVCVTQRKYGGSAALQANKLLLRAVNDAAKSVLNGKDINEYYKPTPIKELISDEFDKFNVKEIEDSRERLVSDSNLNPELNINTSEIKEENSDFYTIKTEPFNTRHIINSKTSSSLGDIFEDFDTSNLNASNSSLLSEENKDSVNPHFIVTLDGVNFSSFKRKRSLEEPMEIDEDNCDIINDQISVKKQRLCERCKYWPACKKSDSCTYHHPKVPCKCFPDCKFGDKCLYIHPNCKFDSLCSRKDCPYTHCSKRKFQAMPTSIFKPTKVQIAKKICKYYPKCTAKYCHFVHPRLCRFGTQCRDPKCLFSHFQIPERNKLKWKANSS